MGDKTLPLLAELQRYSNDPAAFAALRRKVLDAHFASLTPARRSRLQALQCNIEATSAAAGTPSRATSALLDDLIDRCEALEQLKQRL